MKKIFCVLVCILVLGFSVTAEGASSNSQTFTLGGDPVTIGEDDFGPYYSITEVLDGIYGYGIANVTIVIPDDYDIGYNEGSYLFGDGYEIDDDINSLVIQGSRPSIKLIAPFGDRHFVIDDSVPVFTLKNITLVKNEEEDYEEDSPNVNGGIEITGGSITFDGVTFRELNSKSSGVVSITGGTVTFKGSSFNSCYADNGGTVSITGGTVDFADSTFDTCSSDNGGAVNVAGGTASFTGGSFKSCSANNGGAVYADNGSVTFSGTAFSGNSADKGGAIYSKATLKLSNGTAFSTSKNKARLGGALYIEGGETATEGTVNFDGNTAEDGGAVYIENGTLNANSAVTFSSNEASGNGGAVYIAGGSFTASSAAFDGNISAGDGGAVYSPNGSSTVTFSEITFSGNSADRGGAVYSNSAMNLNAGTKFSAANKARLGGALYVAGMTATIGGEVEFSSNTASENGGAVYLEKGSITGNAASDFTGNTAYGSGGAIYIAGGGFASSAADSFTNNIAYSNGGAVYVFSSARDNRWTGNIEFTGNTAGTLKAEGWPSDPEEPSVDDGFGGALYIGGTAVFSGQTEFNRNMANNGGAVYIPSGGDLQFSEVSYFGNNEGNQAYNGGALYLASESSITFSNTAAFSGNIARNSGGAIMAAGMRRFSFSSDYKYTFTDNKANYDNGLKGGGGAIFWGASNTSSLTSELSSADFSGNTTEGVPDIDEGNDAAAGSGGALFISSDQGLVIGSGYSFANNKAYNNGGSIYLTTAGIRFSSTNFDESTSSQAVNGNGGFVYTGGDITFENVSIDCINIKAEKGNGGFAYAEGKVTITGDSVLYSSALSSTAKNAGNYGGCVYAEGDITIGSSTIYGFRATAGGAVYGASNITITGGTLRDNLTRGSDANIGGGAVFADGDFEATGTLFTGNQHTSEGGNSNGGGAVYTTGRLTVTDCIFESNQVNTTGNGGAILLNNELTSESSITNSLFSGDTAPGDGGAVYAIIDGTLNFASLSFVNNSANGGEGGAVYVATRDYFNVSGSYFFNNVARSSNGGGALYFSQLQGKIRITDSVFRENYAREGDGGAAYIQAYDGYIRRCTFDTNMASQQTSDTKGGALYIETSNAGDIIAVDTCTFFGNRALSGSKAAKGGALYTVGLVDVKSSTFTKNIALLGGAIYVSAENRSKAVLNLTATIAVENYEITGSDIYLEGGGGIFSNGYNRVGVISNTTASSSATDWSIVDGTTGTDKTPKDTRPEIPEWTAATFFGSNAALAVNETRNSTSSNMQPPLVGAVLEGISEEANERIKTVMLDEDDLLPRDVRAMDAIPRDIAGMLDIAATDQRGETRPLPVGGPLDIGAYEVDQPGIYDPEHPTENFSIQSVFMSGIPNIMRSLGQTVNLIAMVRYENGTTTYSNADTEPVTWSSSNQNIVRIDSKGVMTAIAPTPDNDYVTISVRTRTASDGSFASASSPVRVILQYSYMNISPEWQTYFADYVRDIAEHDIAVDIADSNSSSVSSSSFQRNFKKLWNAGSVRQITNISGVTPEFGTASSSGSPSGVVSAKDVAVKINYKGRSNGDILPLKYLWTFSGEELNQILRRDVDISSASLADEIFPALQIDFEGENGTWTVIGDGGVSAQDAVSSGALKLTKTDGGNGVMVELTAYLANVEASDDNGPQLVKSDSKSLLVVPDGNNDGAISGTMWMAKRSSVTVQAQSGIRSGGSGSDSGSDSEDGAGCEALGLGLIGAAVFFALRRR